MASHPLLAGSEPSRQIVSMVRPALDISLLTVSERLELIEELWASLAHRPETLPFTAAQTALFVERLAEHSNDPDSAIPWERIRAELEADQDADHRARSELQEPRG